MPKNTGEVDGGNRDVAQTPRYFLFGLREVLADPNRVVNDNRISAMLHRLSYKSAQPLGNLGNAACEFGDGMSGWEPLARLIQDIGKTQPDLCKQLTEAKHRAAEEATRFERAAFVAGYFFARDPLALLGAEIGADGEFAGLEG